MAHTWDSQGGKTGVGGVGLGRPSRGQVLNSKPGGPRGAPATCGKSTPELQLHHLPAVLPEGLLLLPRTSVSLLGIADRCLWDVVSVSPRLSYL